jgi:hypothetical protein
MSIPKRALCPIIITRTFTIIDHCDNETVCVQEIRMIPTPVTVNCPPDVTVPQCATLAEIQTAYNNWIAGFSFEGGCDEATDNIGDIPPLPTALCEGINLSFTYSAQDSCTNATCTSTFSMPAPTPVTVNCPPDVTVPQCATLAEIQTAYNNWIAGFSFEGGCDEATDNIGDIPPLPTALCEGINLSFTYSAQDSCTNATCTSTFSMPAPTPVTVNCPPDVTVPQCATLAEIQTAYNNWIAGFSFEGGCDEATDNIGDIPPLPTALCEGINLSFTYSAQDSCTNATCTSTFSMPAPTPVTVNCPPDVTVPQCATLAEIQTAYNNWIAGFSFEGGCDEATDNIGDIPPLPTALCEGINLSFTYSAQDSCTNATCTSTFSMPAPTPVTVNCPPDVTVPQCATLAEIQTAYNNWIAGFSFEGGCDEATDNIGDIPPLPTALCEGINLSFTYSAQDSCTNATCTSTFSMPAPTPVTVNCPPDVTVPQCATLAEIQTAYNNWIAGFSFEGGCDEATDNIGDIPPLPTALCEGINLSFTYSAQDSCTNATCTSTFSMPAPTPVTVNCPPDVTVPQCATLAEIQTAYNNWIAGFSFEGGCDEATDNIGDIPPLPTALCEGINLSFTYSAQDSCTNATCTSTFSMPAPTPVTVNCPPDVTVPQCATLAEIQTAYNNWIAGFSFEGGCDEATDNIGDIPPLPTALCEGINLSFTYSAQDSCTNATCTSTFSMPAPTPVTVNCPPDVTVPQCATLAEIQTAYNNWIAGFSFEGGCDEATDNIGDIPPLPTALCEGINLSFTYSAQDSCTNATCTSTFSMPAPTPVTVNCPPDVTVPQCATLAEIQTAYNNWIAGFSFEGGCDEATDNIGDIPPLPTALCEGINLSFTYSAQDSCTNATCTSTFSMPAPTPVTVNCPPDVTVPQCATLAEIQTAYNNWIAGFSFEGGCDEATDNIGDIPPLPTALCEGINLSFTYSAQDSCTNATCTSTFSMPAPTPVTVNCPPDVTVPQCATLAEIQTAYNNWIAGFSFEGGCDEATDNIGDIPPLPTALCEGINLSFTYSAQDSCTNATCTSTFSMPAPTPVTVNCPPDVTVPQCATLAEIQTAYNNWIAGFSFEGGCDEATDNIGDIPPLPTALCEGINLSFTYSAQDSCTNATCTSTFSMPAPTPVTVNCPPDVTVPQCATLAEIQTAYNNWIAGFSFEGGCDEATDNIGDIPPLPTALCEGINLSFTYSAQDSCTNATCTSTFSMPAPTPVTVNCPPDVTVPQCATLAEIQTAYNNWIAGFSFEGGCDEATDNIGDIPPLPTALCEGINLSFTYSAQDSCTNATCTSTFSMPAPTPVTVNCPPDVTVPQCATLAEIQTAYNNWIAGFSFEGGCDEATDNIGDIPPLPTALCEGINLSFTYSAQDSCTNATCTSTFSMPAPTPVTVNCPPDVTVPQCATLAEIQTAYNNWIAGFSFEGGCDEATDNIGDIPPLPTALCEGINLSFTYSAQDSCTNATCTSTFSMPAPTPVTVNCPPDVTVPQCATLAEIQTAYNNWIAGFSFEGGCDEATDNIGDIPPLPTALCEGINLSFTYSAQDSCTNATCTSTFSMPAPTPVTVNCPPDVTVPQCATLAEIQTAYNNWIAGFSFEGGCDEATDNIGDIPPLPTALCEGINLSFTYSAQDSCTNATCTSTFSMPAPTPVTVNCPPDVTVPQCATLAEIQTAYNNWIAGFSFEGGCDEATDNIGDIPPLPTALCEGINLSFTYSAQDSCTNATCTSTFSMPAPTPVTVNCPPDVTVPQCATLAEIQTAYNNWIAGFSFEGGCDEATDNIGDIPPLPTALCEGINLSFTYSAQDSCTNATCTSTFSMPAPTPVTVNCPPDVTVPQCATLAEIQTAYNNWIAGFSFEGGCDEATDNIGDIPPLPTALCEGINLSFTYSAQDSCTNATCTSTFSMPAPTPVTVNCPPDVTVPQCATLAEIQTAYNNWIAGFSFEGGCDEATDNIGDIPPLPTALCEGINLSFTYSAQDSCTNATCTSTFSMPAPTPVTVNCPPDVTVPQCATLAEIQTAYNNWIAGFSFEGGCDEATDNIGDIPPLPTALCEGINLSFTYSAQDSCTNATCTSTFSMPAPTPVTVNCPPDVTVPQCATLAEIQTAYNNWIAGFSFEGGCDEATDNIGDIPPLPTALCEGINLSFTYSAQDSCTNATCTSTFSMPAPTPVTVNCPPDVTVPQCATLAEIQTAYNNWIAGFSFEGGCDEATDNIGDIPPLPTALCEGINLSFTYSAQDSCTNATCTSTFSMPAPTPVTVNCPPDVTVPQCATLAEIQTAYNNWIAGFSFEGGCDEATDNIGDIPPLPTALCEGINLSFTYTASDECTDDECTSTFVVAPAEPVEVTCPANVDLPACTSDADIQTAYTAWIAGFSFSGGCGTTDNIVDVPELPANLCAGMNLSFTYTASDECTDDECTSTFVVAPAEPVEVTCPANVDLPACTSDADIQTAYTAWIAGFSFSGGCGTTDNIVDVPELPTTCVQA